MYSALKDVLSGNEDNALLPFYWQHGDHTEKIPSQIERIAHSGCRAICVEARPHKDFGGEGWWRDMDLILSEAQKRNMQVWLLDDDHFPTGHANGMITKKYPRLRPWLLIEDHIDVVGPMKSATVLVPPLGEEGVLLGAFAYPRYADDAEICQNEPLDLTPLIRNGAVTWDIPEGLWRVFFYARSREGGNKDYIDVINPESTDVLIEAVYEPHLEHYKQYFGNTFAGFFSDEPGFKNQYRAKTRTDMGRYEMTVGRVGLALPWNDEVRERMREALGYDPLPHLWLLWYDDETGDARAALRSSYMDAVTEMYRLHFCRRLGDWCHAHGVEYIGHVIEDNGTHARMSYGAGHYFRSLDGQDMSGIDIVLHQVLPGMSDTTHTACVSTGVAKGPFFHYTLAKLAASMAHLHPNQKKRAMCEVFGAYGWAEGTPLMKWLMDFLLVRGINRFVPHAFSPVFPDRDCPPHFDAEGHDPTFEGFSALMRYVNRAAHLLYGGTHIANAALLYHAEAEWASKVGGSMPVDTLGRVLLDAHIDYDIVPMDYLKNATVQNGKLCIADESFDVLLVPAATHLPAAFYPVLRALEEQGLPIRFVDALPQNAPEGFATVPLASLPSYMKENGYYDVSVPSGTPKLRIYHTRRDGHDIFMLFNEDVAAAKTTVTLPTKGSYAVVDALTETYLAAHTEDGRVGVSLQNGQSVILVFGDAEDLPTAREITATQTLQPRFSLELADAKNPWEFAPAGQFDELFNVTAPDRFPELSGKMRYTFTFDARDAAGAILDLGQVGEVAELTLNGEDMGIRICRPYAFDISKALRAGINEATVTVSNTLVWQNRDRFSRFLQIPPSGLLGEITLKYLK